MTLVETSFLNKLAIKSRVFFVLNKDAHAAVWKSGLGTVI